jgi:hypothetical protein
MRPVPVKLDAVNCTIFKADNRNTLPFTPPTGAESLPQSSYLAYPLPIAIVWISSIVPMTSKSSPIGLTLRHRFAHHSRYLLRTSRAISTFKSIRTPALLALAARKCPVLTKCLNSCMGTSTTVRSRRAQRLDSKHQRRGLYFFEILNF